MLVRDRISAFALVFFAALFLCFCPDVAKPASARSGKPESAAKSPVIVIGFVGGWVSRNNSVHREVSLAAELRRDYPEGVFVEVYENHHPEEARRAISRLLDLDHDGSLSAAEKKDARIIIYGHSWGACETVTLARWLNRQGIPVLLTIQVDSITKPGENDVIIPPNVRQAINFYQPDGILHGAPVIRAADPSRTQVLGNLRFEYKDHPVDCTSFPWLARTLELTHIEIETDPRVWGRIDSMIRSHLPTSSQTLASASGPNHSQATSQ